MESFHFKEKGEISGHRKQIEQKKTLRIKDEADYFPPFCHMSSNIKQNEFVGTESNVPIFPSKQI